MTDFDMPPVSAGFEARGGWVVRKLAAEFGLTLEQAAGIVGNLGFESIGFATLQEIKPAIEGSKGGYGWAQWTATRRATFELFCKNQNLKPSSDEANYGFLVTELHGSHASTISALKRCITLDQAVFSVGQTYERPDGTTASYLPGGEARLSWGRRALVGAKTLTPDVISGPLPSPQEAVGRPVSDADAVESVKALQRMLVSARRYKGAVDGICGPQTAAAAMAAYNATRGGQ